MCGQLVSLGDDGDSGKHPINTSSELWGKVPNPPRGGTLKGIVSTLCPSCFLSLAHPHALKGLSSFSARMAAAATHGGTCL